MLKVHYWPETAEFESTVAQSHRAGPRAVQTAPYDTESLYWANGKQVVKRDRKAGALLDRRLAAGLSRFEPDPAAALRAKKAGWRLTSDQKAGGQRRYSVGRASRSSCFAPGAWCLAQ